MVHDEIRAFPNGSFGFAVVLCVALPCCALADDACGAAGCTRKSFNGFDACVTADGCLHICEVNFPSEAFREWLTAPNPSGLNLCGGYTSGKITLKQCRERTVLSCDNQQIDSLKGIAFFSGLKSLSCDGNRLIELDVSHNTLLEQLACSQNDLEQLNVSGNPALSELYCSYNRLTSLDVSSCTALSELWCCENLLSKLNVSGCTHLTRFYCYVNQLASLDVSACTRLASLWCASNQLTSLDVSANTRLTGLHCSYNLLAALDVSSNSLLAYLECGSNQLASLDVSQNTALRCWAAIRTSLLPWMSAAMRV